MYNGKICRVMASVFYYFLFLLFTVVSFIPFTLLFLLTVRFDRERVALHRASRLWSLGIYRLCPFWKIEVNGREKIDRSKPYVIVTNHQSMLDVPLMYVLPLNFKWVSKREVMKFPIFGWVLRMHGDIAIERGSSSSARHMMTMADDYLRRGTSVILFPEGTRTKTGRMGRFKEGGFLMAKSAGVGILPVVHDGNYEVLNGWRLRMPHRFRVQVLDPIAPERVMATDVKQLTREVEQMMGDLHRQMAPEYYAEEAGSAKSAGVLNEEKK